MTGCTHEVTIEDLALGLLDDAEAARARAHLDRCVACRRAHAQLQRERALLSACAEAIGPAPPLAVDAAPPPPSRMARIHAFAALVACAAAFVLLVARAHRTSPAPSATEAFAARDVPAASDEPLACAFPASGFPYRGESEPLACGNVTFSSAGP